MKKVGKTQKKRKSSFQTKRTNRRMKKVSFCNVIRNSKGGCLWFGGETTKASSFFGFNNDFDTFEHMINLTKVGDESANGVVYKIDYSKEGYLSSAILKSSLSSDADNLYYEYFVGKHFVNKMNLQYSCFVQTYNIYKSIDPTFRANNKNSLSSVNFNTNFQKLNEQTITDVDYCLDSRWLSILIETVPNAITLGKYLSKVLQRHIVSSTRPTKKKDYLEHQIQEYL